MRVCLHWPSWEESVSDNIKSWLQTLALEKYAALFIENDIDVSVLAYITDEDLKELGVTVGGRRKILAAAASMASTASASVPAVENAPTAQPAVAERRQVTVMFCDLAASTALSTQLDAEDMREVILAYQTAASDAIKRHDGFVARYMGDGILVYFGYPKARENDAKRAIAAGMSIIADVTTLKLPPITRLGQTLSVRVGIASGEVVVGDIIGEGASQEAAITGEAPNLAARVQSIAVPNTIAVSQSTHQLSAEAFSFEELPSAMVKGFSTPQRIFQVLSAKEGVATGYLPGTPRTQFVGRLQEHNAILNAATQATKVGAGQMILIRGEAGIGKTRLTSEITEALSTSGFGVHKGLVLDFGLEQGRDAVRSILRDAIRELVHDTKEVSSTAVSALINEGMLDASNAIFLNDLLSLEQESDQSSLLNAMDGETRKKGKLDTIQEFVQGLGRRQKTLIVVEDVHWADKETLESLAALARGCKAAPVVLLMTSRIVGDPLDQTWRAEAGNQYLLTIDLGPLDSSDALQLAKAFDVLDATVLARFVERSEGNPLFLEEMLRNASELGSEHVPPTLQTLILARLDRLEARDRNAAQAGASIGQRFSPDVLRFVIDDPDYNFDNLARQNIVRPDAGEMQFTHALIQDVAYESQLRATKRNIHRRAAQWFNDRDAILYARHLEMAEDPLAAKAYLDAATDAAARNEDESVLELFERGTPLAQDDETRLRLGFLAGDALRNIGRTDDSILMFRQAAETAIDTTLKCAALVGIAEGLRISNQYHEALGVLEQAQAVSHGQKAAIRARIFQLRGSISFHLGDIDSCLEAQSMSLKLAKEAGDPITEATSLSNSGDAYYLQGMMIDARNRFDECLALSHKHGLGKIEVSNRSMVGWSRVHMMEFREALQDGAACAEMAARVNNLREGGQGHTLAGYCAKMLGAYEDSVDWSEAGLAFYERIGAPVFSLNSYGLLAEAYAYTGQMADARLSIAKAMNILESSGQSFLGPYILAVAATLAESDEKSLTLVEKAVSILDAGCVSHNYMWFTNIMVNFELQRGNSAAALEHANRLEIYNQRQPLLYSSYLVSRTRAEASLIANAHDPQARQKLQAVAAIAEAAGLRRDVEAIKHRLSA